MKTDDNYSLIPENEFVILYHFVEKNIFDKDYPNARNALNLLNTIFNDSVIDKSTYQHCIMICRMLIDLNLKLSDSESDILLASSICHIMPEEIINAFSKDNDATEEIVNIIRLINNLENASDKDFQEYVDAVQNNKLAVLIALTDRGNMVEQLHSMNYWQIRRFIYNTRRYYFPMCIYAKEHYHELLSPTGILLEKLRNLTDVSEILITKFENMEIELTQEIFALKEENATIKGIINKLKNE